MTNKHAWHEALVNLLAWSLKSSSRPESGANWKQCLRLTWFSKSGVSPTRTACRMSLADGCALLRKARLQGRTADMEEQWCRQCGALFGGGWQWTELFNFVITTSLYVTFLQWFKWSRMLLFYALVSYCYRLSYRPLRLKSMIEWEYSCSRGSDWEH